MTRESDAELRLAQQLVAIFWQIPPAAKIGLFALVFVAAGFFYYLISIPKPASELGGTTPEAVAAGLGMPEGSPSSEQPGTSGNVPPPAAPFPPGSRTVVLCVWNMENLFDDHEDHRRPPDEEFDLWFARDAASRTKKYHNLALALLKMNGGNGPDVIVGNELETIRSAVMLQDALNSGRPSGAAPYRHVVYKELANAGRHIAPAIVSRFPLEQVRLLGHRQRILEAHLKVNGHDLLLVASHWTSHLSDDGHRAMGGRTGYAEVIADLYEEAIRANPKVDFLVCGDFNDSPEADAIANTLHMVGDYRRVTADTKPARMFGLLSGRSPDEFGTIYYKQPLIYDHIGLSPGMFDASGWGYDPASIRVPTDGLIEPGIRARRPWRFGTPKEVHARGYSDHFPVVVDLKVAP